MEQLTLEVTQTLLRDRNAQVVRDAETRRMLRERAALGRSAVGVASAASSAGAANAAVSSAGPGAEGTRRGLLARLAERRPARRRAAVS